MHFIELYSFALDLYINSLNHFIWKRLKVTVCGRLPLSRYANTWLDHDDVSIGLYCALLTFQWKANLGSTSVMNTWPLGYNNTTWKSKQKICTNFDHYWTKKWSFLCMQTNWVCRSEALWFRKNDSDSGLESLIVTRVKSFCEKRDSSRVTKNRDSSRVIDSSHAITAGKWETKRDKPHQINS